MIIFVILFIFISSTLPTTAALSDNYPVCMKIINCMIPEVTQGLPDVGFIFLFRDLLLFGLGGGFARDRFKKTELFNKLNFYILLFIAQSPKGGIQ